MPGLKWQQQIIGKGCSCVASQVCYVTENIQPWVQEGGDSRPSLKNPHLTEGCSSPASRRCCAAAFQAVNFSPCPWLDCPGQVAISVLLAKSQSVFSIVNVSEVHLITFPPFSLGAGDLHSLHLNQISGTSILRRLRRRKHQYFTEHKKLHNSQFLFWCQLWLVGHIYFFL